MNGELSKLKLMKNMVSKIIKNKRIGSRNCKTVGNREKESLLGIDPKRRRPPRPKKRKMRTQMPNLLHSTTKRKIKRVNKRLTRIRKR
jgi:hypothetical protein